MKHFTIILLLFIYQSIAGQTYPTKMIIAKADSILKITVGDSVYKYYHYDKLSCYEYNNSKNKPNLKYLTKNKNTKGHFRYADVRFYFSHPILKGICILTSVKLDSNLNLMDSICLEQIPDFIKQGKPCDFISSEKALGIAKDSIKYKGIEQVKEYFDYNSKHKRYVYIVYNVLSRQPDSQGLDSGEEETIIIDAITGKILEHWKGWYGTID